MHQIQIILN